jgi:hypothetical protein
MRHLIPILAVLNLPGAVGYPRPITSLAGSCVYAPVEAVGVTERTLVWSEEDAHCPAGQSMLFNVGFETAATMDLSAQTKDVQTYRSAVFAQDTVDRYSGKTGGCVDTPTGWQPEAPQSPVVWRVARPRSGACSGGAHAFANMPEPGNRRFDGTARRRLATRNVQDLVGKCWTAPMTAAGVGESFIVWDPDAPCGAGQSWIHNVGTEPGSPMTAGAGALVHRYVSGRFDTTTVAEYSGTAGSCQPIPRGGSDLASWHVARAGHTEACGTVRR